MPEDNDNTGIDEPSVGDQLPVDPVPLEMPDVVPEVRVDAPREPVTPVDDSEHRLRIVRGLLDRMHPLLRRGQLPREIVERMQKLQFVELTIDPDVPPELALQEIEELYDGNLMPDEVFWHLSQGADVDFLEEAQQGMLNRFRPTPRERALYPAGYESVGEQMYADMAGGEERPGDYRVFGFRDEAGVLRAWESFRLPSNNPEKMRRYREHLDATLFNPEYVHLEAGIAPKLRKANYRLIEFDTANVSRGWEVAGTLLLWRTLCHLRDEMGDQMPPGLFFHRFVGLAPVHPKPVDDEFDLDLGENDRTARAARRWGCADIGYRHDPHERVVREVPHCPVPIQVNPKWRHSSAKIKIMIERCDLYLREKGLIDGDEEDDVD